MEINHLDRESDEMDTSAFVPSGSWDVISGEDYRSAKRLCLEVARLSSQLVTQPTDISFIDSIRNINIISSEQQE